MPEHLDQYDWLLFDLDNTLLDFSASERHALSQVCKEESIHLDEDHYLLYKNINKECWTAFEEGRLPKSQLRTLRFSRFFEAYGISVDANEIAHNYLNYLSQSAIYLGDAEAVLNQLGQQFRLGLITNGLKEVQRPRLQSINMQRFFEVIVVSDEIGPAKPAKAFFDHAFQEMGQPSPNKTLVIGDNLGADIKGGANYGTHTAWINPESKSSYIENLEPTYSLHKVEDMLNLLGG